MFLKQVSQVTMRPSETGMYDLLQCTKKWLIAYSQVYVEGESGTISTPKDMDAIYVQPNRHLRTGGSPSLFALVDKDRSEHGDM